MKRYNIIDDRGCYWSRWDYHGQDYNGYWSKFDDNHSINNRRVYFKLFGLIILWRMKNCDVKATLKEIK